MEELLKVKNLKTHFYTPEKVIPAVDGVSFHIKKGETLCIVGESGSGKSVTSLSIMQLVQSPPGKYVDGQILFKGEDILKLEASPLSLSQTLSRWHCACSSEPKRTS